MIPHTCSRTARAQAGFGIMQAMLILLLVACALAAGAWMLQSRVSAQQAGGQEKNLRWADEALVAFAGANARLPCPAAEVNGEEACGNTAAHWLPTATLANVYGQGVSPGPIAYRVRPKLSNASNTAWLGNTDQPIDAAGNIRNAETVADSDDPNPVHFTAVNGLDFCRTLQDISSAVADTAAVQHDQALNTWAYGLALAGPNASATGRFDGNNPGVGDDSNDDAAFPLADPATQSGSDYDDSVRLRTLDGVAQSVGCRLLPTSIVAIQPASDDGGSNLPTIVNGNGYYDTAQAGIDSLSMAAALNDSLADLKDNNVGNGQSSVQDATAGVTFTSLAVLLSAGQITDTITSEVTGFTQLASDIATCIIGVGCAMIPKDAAAIGLEIGSVISNGIAMGLNAGALKPARDALSAQQAALSRANAANLPPPDNLADALAQMRITLYGGDVRTCESTPALDGNGLPIYNSDGSPKFDYKNGCDKDPSKGDLVHQDGLQQKVADAKSNLDVVKAHSDLLQQYRLTPWNDANIRDRIGFRTGTSKFFSNDTNLTGVNSSTQYTVWQSWQGGRYDSTSTRTASTCNTSSSASASPAFNEETSSATTISTPYSDSACANVWQDCTVVAPATSCTSPAKYYAHIYKYTLHTFNAALAVSDAKARRTWAETLAGYEKQKDELDDQISQQQSSLDRWKNTLEPQMQSQKKTDCKGQPDYDVFNNNFDQVPTNVLKCVNDIAALQYTDNCKRLDTVLQNGQWVNTVITETDLLPSDPNYDPNAACIPMMQRQLDSLRGQSNALAGNIGNASSNYNATRIPPLAYPDDWPYGHIASSTQTVNGVDVTSYRWEVSSDNYYALEPYGCLSPVDNASCHADPVPSPGNGDDDSAPLWVTSSGLMLAGIPETADDARALCRFLSDDPYNFHGSLCQRYPYSRGYADWLRASDATVAAQDSYNSLLEQFNTLEAQYNQMAAMQFDDTQGGGSLQVAVGAQCILLLADNRGSVGSNAVDANASCAP